MKEYLCLIAAILICLGLFRAVPASAEADFSQDAWDIVEDIVFGWNLGNSLDSYDGTEMTIGDLSSETCWGNPVTTPELIALVKSTGVNAIRVPVTWYNHMDPETLQIDQAWMARVEEVVNYVLDAELYCILNVHHDNGEKGWLNADPDDYAEDERIFIAIWEQIADRFVKYDGKLLFEGYNELLNNQKDWVSPNPACLNAANQLNQAFVDTVRASGGNNAQRVLVVNTYGGQPHSLVTRGMVVPQDTQADRLIVEAHVYQPYEFTSEFYPQVKTWSKAPLDTCLDNLYRDFVQQGYPVIIGEFGLVDKDNMAQRYSWIQHLMDVCTKRGIKCFWWDNGGDYKLFSRRSLKVTEPDILDILLTEATGGDYALDDAALAQLSAKAASGNLCIDPEGWFGWINTAAQASAQVEYTAEGIAVTVHHGGENTWDVQGAYTGLTLEQGVIYRIAFDYKADVAQSTMFHLMKNYGDYRTYYSAPLESAAEIRHFEDTFTMTEATDTNVKIAIDFGGSSVQVPYTMEISNLTLVKLAQEGNGV
ncbi:MAG: glycoside hydrolase family 5 protein [Aristaeellaceae bacterium]